MTSRSRRQLVQGSLAVAGLAVLSACRWGSFTGQRPKTLRRIGYLTAGLGAPTFEAFRAGMRDLGYVEGQDLRIEYRDARRNQERLPALAAELVGLRVEVIVAYNL